MSKSKPKARRRARGTGSLFWHERRKVWVGRVHAGRSATGRILYTQVSAPTQGALLEKLKRVRPPGPETTVREWAQRWLAESTTRPSTRDLYRNTVEQFIAPTLGGVRIAALTTHQCEAAVRQWSLRLAPGSVRVALGQLRNCLNAARRAGLCAGNPARDVRTPKAPRRTVAVYSPDELARIVREASRRVQDYPLALLAATGCRVGEALALDVGDYDQATGTLGITKTWSRRHGTRPPKSETGVRTIRVPLAARTALALAAGDRRRGPLYVVWDGRNRRYHNSVRQAFDALVKRLGLRRLNLHGLRHSVASAMVGANVPLANVAEYLGDTVETIVRTYLHPVAFDPSAVLDGLYGDISVTAPAKRTRNQG